MTSEPARDAESVRVPMRWSYPLRRLWWLIRDPEQACVARHCARPRIGYSCYCRTHLDAILRSVQ
jgi:hypothetical protein